ncbi:MAG TPA: hypothetical protein IAB23_08705 [Candidatus Scybalocola faecavium]|nr:hypothetical protein [Candidatus Scybalocola faecavium]
MSEQNDTFNYNYSAKQQEEIRKIREKYVPKEESKMEQLRRLDASATKPGIIAAMTLGIISTLVLGVGMCCVMVWEDRLFIPGIIIGVIGILGIILAYPLYNRMTKKRREKLAPEILRLTDELSKQG